MKKILLLTATCALGILGASAQQKGTANCTPCPEGCTPATCTAPQCNKPCFDPFAGLNLSADQQTKLQALKAECKAQKQQTKADKKALRQQAKADCKARRAENRKAMLAKVKDILTPEQYVTFLENAFVNDSPRGSRDNHHAQLRGGDRKHDKAFKKGDRSNRQADGKEQGRPDAPSQNL